MYLKEQDGKILADCYAVQALFPEEYLNAAYRAHAYYSLLGTKVRVFGVGRMRFFDNEKQMETPEQSPCYTLGIPMLITMEPSDISIESIRTTPNGPVRKWIILTFYKGDSFMVSTEVIKNTDYAMIYLSRLKQGKLDYMPPEHVLIIQDRVQSYNGINFRIPSEEEEIFVVEKYRDPDYPERKYRFHTGKVDPENIVTHNTRTDVMSTTGFQALFGEDINTSLLVNSNRRRNGIKDEVSAFEATIRGMDLDYLSKRDYGENGLGSPMDMENAEEG